MVSKDPTFPQPRGLTWIKQPIITAKYILTEDFNDLRIASKLYALFWEVIGLLANPKVNKKVFFKVST